MARRARDGLSAVAEEDGPHLVDRLIDRSRRIAAARAFRWGFLLLTVVLAAVALAIDGEEFLLGVRRLGAVSLGLALVATVGNIIASAAAWRSALSDLGSPLRLSAAGHVFLVGQLGKYLPGSIWHVVAQIELAAQHGVARRRAASATVVHMAIVVTAALLVGLASFALVPDLLPGGYSWFALGIVPLLVLLYPPILNRVLGRVVRLARREPLEHSVSAGGAARTMLWALLSWLAIGAQTLVLVTRVGGVELGWRVAVLCVGAFGVAWVVGFVTFISPAGAGAREAALVLMLSGVLSPGRALLVAIVSRVLMTGADLGLAGAALLWRRLTRPGSAGP